MIAVCDHSDFKVAVSLGHFSTDLGFFQKQVDTYVIYLLILSLPELITAGLFSSKTFPLAFPLGFLKFPVSLHSDLF